MRGARRAMCSTQGMVRHTAASKIETVRGHLAMTEELMPLAKLFRIIASQLRRLAEGPIQHDNRSLAAIEAYFYKTSCVAPRRFLPTSASRRQIVSRSLDWLSTLSD